MPLIPDSVRAENSSLPPSESVVRSVPAFGYLRVSSKFQLQGDGFDRQRQMIGSYAAQNGLTVVRWFQEEGVSGAIDCGSRPAWLQMIQAIMEDGGTKTILVERLDRLARDLMIQEHIIADVRKRRITLISVAEPDMCHDDPTRKLMRQIMGAIAEYDKTMIVLKLRGARQRAKARTGRCEGIKPYGELPGEAAVLEIMGSSRSEGMSIARITRNLNAAEQKPRRGKVWHENTVARILRRVSATSAV